MRLISSNGNRVIPTAALILCIFRDSSNAFSPAFRPQPTTALLGQQRQYHQHQQTHYQQHKQYHQHHRLLLTRGGSSVIKSRHDASSNNNSRLAAAVIITAQEDSFPQKKSAAVLSNSAKTLLRTLASTTLFVLLNMLFKMALSGIAFPSPLAGCGALFATMLAFPTLGAQIYTVLHPGAAFLAKWLQVFLVPSLIQLPLAPSFASGTEAAKAAVIIGGGFMASLLLTAYSVLGVRRLTGRECDVPGPNCAKTADVATTNTNNKPAAKPFSDTTITRLRSAMAVSGAMAVASSKLPWFHTGLATPMATMFMLSSTIHNFVFGARFPKKVTKILHPLVTCTTMTWMSATVLSKLTGTTFHSALGAFKTGSLSASTAGAGDVLMFLLGPAIFSLGISMYDRRKLMKENMAEVATSIGVSTFSGLFGTAALVRLLMSTASKSVALSLLSRNITSALAMVTGSLLGADISLTVSIAIVTGLLGANFGASILNACGIQDPVARGLAIGAASHGLGTAAIANEKDAFPFAAIAMTLVASFSAAVVSVPVLKNMLVNLALGGV